NLEGLWVNFASRDDTIQRTLKGEKIDHGYFRNNYFLEIRNLVSEYQNIFTTNLSTLQAETASLTSTEEDLEIESMFREQRVLIDTLERIMSKVTIETRQNFKAIIFENWTEIKRIHVQIHKKFKNPKELGYDDSRY
ncbi:uncharacterized protein LOC122319960, partial [Drosophila ficusphila]|uniref:uncharacterized protein LOC122319960 n=1 Tax=Drosophila ficusphila TaxID=30025 RepID=UPI001C8ADACE